MTAFQLRASPGTACHSPSRGGQAEKQPGRRRDGDAKDQACLWDTGLGFRGLGFGVWGLGFRGLGFRVWGVEFRVWGLGFRDWSLGFRAWGLGS